MSAQSFDALDHALMALGDEVMMLGELDGFIAGLLLCPELIAPSEWLAEVWGGEDADEDPGFDSSEQAQSVIGLIMAHYNAVADTLHRRPGRYGPLLDVSEPTDEVFWEFWIDGFKRAVALRHEAWEPMLHGEGEASEALILLLSLAVIAEQDVEHDIPPADVAEMQTNAPDIIAECVGILAADRNSRLPTRGPKVGRNDPCPCGSGKKHKKCCGAAG
jgi:uncharacterized protein